MRFEYVDQPGYKVVTVREANLGGYVVGRVQGNVNNMELLLNPDILRNGYYESLVMTIAHELGHAHGHERDADDGREPHETLRRHQLHQQARQGAGRGDEHVVAAPGLDARRGRPRTPPPSSPSSSPRPIRGREHGGFRVLVRAAGASRSGARPGPRRRGGRPLR